MTTPIGDVILQLLPNHKYFVKGLVIIKAFEFFASHSVLLEAAGAGGSRLLLDTSIRTPKTKDYDCKMLVPLRFHSMCACRVRIM